LQSICAGEIAASRLVAALCSRSLTDNLVPPGMESRGPACRARRPRFHARAPSLIFQRWSGFTGAMIKVGSARQFIPGTSM
jgi:hypothetical protein